MKPRGTGPSILVTVATILLVVAVFAVLMGFFAIFGVL